MDSHNPVVSSGEQTGQLVRKARDRQSGRQRWKNLHTRIIVISRFGKKYSSKKIQLSIQDAVEKINVLASSTSAKKQPTGCSSTLESPFSPQCSLAQEDCNQKVQKVPCLEHLGSLLKKCSSSIDPLDLSRFLLVLLCLQFLPEDSLDESIAGMVFFTVVVVVLTPRMEGAAPTELVRVIIQTATKSQLLWLILLSSRLVTGVCTESSVQTRVESKAAPNTQETTYYIKTVAITICLGCFTIAVAKKILTNLNTRPERLCNEDDIVDRLSQTEYKQSNLDLVIRPKILT